MPKSTFEFNQFMNVYVYGARHSNCAYATILWSIVCVQQHTQPKDKYWCVLWLQAHLFRHRHVVYLFGLTRMQNNYEPAKTNMLFVSNGQHVRKFAVFSNEMQCLPNGLFHWKIHSAKWMQWQLLQPIRIVLVMTRFIEWYVESTWTVTYDCNGPNKLTEILIECQSNYFFNSLQLKYISRKNTHRIQRMLSKIFCVLYYDGISYFNSVE